MLLVYHNSTDGTIMTQSDLLNWLSYAKAESSPYRDWSFDELTGGPSEFVSPDDYRNAKAECNLLFL